jgi:hypothetical protein
MVENGHKVSPRAHQHADREGIKIITQNGMAKRNKLRSMVHCLAMCNSSILSARACVLLALGCNLKSLTSAQYSGSRAASLSSHHASQRKSAQERSYICTHRRRRCLETIYYNPQGPELLIVGESRLFCVIIPICACSQCDVT